MRLDRVDLADLHAPAALAGALHRQLGPLPGAVPVVEIAHALDIEKVVEAQLDGCEGVLLTDRARSRGRILVNTGRGPQAMRFGIAHELGHFLMERHKLGLDGVLACTTDDMRQSRTARRHKKQEVEANEFAIGLLAPPYATAPILATDPSLAAAEALKRRLDLSREAALRCLVARHDEPLAAVWSRNGGIQYIVRGPRFPWITRDLGGQVSTLSRTRAALDRGRLGTIALAEVAPAAWTDPDLSELFEEVRIGAEGRAVTLLWATLPAEPEED